MRRLIALSLVAASFAVAQDAKTPMRGMRHPALSPDGKRIAFSWHGDIWVCPVDGGTARRVTEDAADEQKPCWSPDGTRIAFSSDKHATRDVFVVTLESREVRRLTHHSADDDGPAWSPDGKWIAFASNRDGTMDLALNDNVFDVWRMPAEGGTATRVTRFRGESPSYSPDGKWIAYDRYSTGYSEGEHNVFIIAADGSGVPREIASGAEDSRHPVWKGPAIYFSHEANGILTSGARNIWKTTPAGGALVQVTGVRVDHCTWPTTCEKSDTLVFENDFELYAINTRDAKPMPRKLIIVSEPYREEETAKRTFKEGAKSPAWSPDGARFVCVVDGDLVVMNADGSGARALTRTSEEERDPSWTPDGKSIVYVRGAWGGLGHVYRLSRDGGEPEALTKEPGIYRAPKHDGKRLAVAREVDGEKGVVAGDRVIDERGVEESWPAWGPDGTLAYVRGTSIVVGDRTHAADANAKTGLAWSPDGKSIAYGVREERTWNVHVLDVGSGVSTALPAESGTSRQSPSWAPDSSMIAHEETRTQRFRSSEAGERIVVRDAKDTKVRIEVAWSVEKPYSRREEMVAIFTQVWNAYNTAYYDPFFHGVDWPGMRDKYGPLAAEARTMPELWELINDMIRELRSSHVHLSPPAPRVSTHTGMLGADVDASMKVVRVEPLGPAAKAGIREGETLVVEGDLDRVLVADQAAELKVRDADGEERTVKVTPISKTALRALRYANQIAWRKEKVKELSEGKLAYHHIKMMMAPEVTALKGAMEKDFPAAQGLVLDIRDGVGGMAHKPVCHLLDSGAPERINKSPAGWMRNRNGWTGPDKYGAGQMGGRISGKSWDRPVVMIQNEISRSDKEILPHTFRHAGIGYIVGMPTAGGVIGGNDVPVRGGARITVSIQGWFTGDGRNMEGWGVPPDFRVPLTHEDLYAGRDPQLEKAVEVVLAQMDGKLAAPRK